MGGGVAQAEAALVDQGPRAGRGAWSPALRQPRLGRSPAGAVEVGSVTEATVWTRSPCRSPAASRTSPRNRSLGRRVQPRAVRQVDAGTETHPAAVGPAPPARCRAVRGTSPGSRPEIRHSFRRRPRPARRMPPRPEVPRHPDAKPEDLGVEIVAGARSANLLDGARIVEREAGAPSARRAARNGSNPNPRPRLGHRIDGAYAGSPWAGAGHARQRQTRSPVRAAGRAVHEAKKIACLTNARTDSYVEAMIRSQNAWFFYFTSPGAARCPSGVGSVP